MNILLARMRVYIGVGGMKVCAVPYKSVCGTLQVDAYICLRQLTVFMACSASVLLSLTTTMSPAQFPFPSTSLSRVNCPPSAYRPSGLGLACDKGLQSLQQVAWLVEFFFLKII